MSQYRPFLSFDFVNNSVTSPLITHTRSTTSTRINPTTGLVETVAANVPRLNGKQELWKAGSKNLIPYSGDFSTDAWGKTGGYGTAGTASAIPHVNRMIVGYGWLVNLPTGGTQGRFLNLVSVSNGTTYSASVTVKRGSSASVFFFADLAVIGIGVEFNFDTLAISSVSPGYTSNHTALELGDGWYRIGFTFAAPSTTLQVGFLSNADSSVYAGEVQLELGSSATAYEPNPVVIQPGLLIEGSATNYCHRSAESTGWGFEGGTVFSSLVTAPDGTNTAIKTAGAGGYMYIVLPVAAPAGAIVLSAWVKADGEGTFTMEGTNTIAKGGIPVTTEFRRVYFAFTSPSGYTPQIAFSVVPSGFTFWGVTVEPGTIPSSYIPTAGTAVTRAADAVSIDVSKIWNPTEGTIICETDFGPVNGAAQVVVEDNITGLSLYRAASGVLYFFVGTATATLGHTTDRCRAACCLSSGSAKFSVNGAALVAIATTLPGTASLRLGAAYSGSYPLNGTMQSLQYHRFAFDDYTLKASSVLK